MLLKVILISIILLVIAFLGFGIKLLFDKNAKLPAGSCQAAHDTHTDFSCGCGGGHCANQEINA